MACKALWWSNFWVPFSPLHSFSCLLTSASLLAISWAFQICSWSEPLHLLLLFSGTPHSYGSLPCLTQFLFKSEHFQKASFLLHHSLVLLYLFQIIYEDVLVCSLPFLLKWQFLRPGIVPILHILSVWNNGWHINAE